MPNKVKTSSEVLVVGAGPVGMFTALRLAECGIGVQLIDQESRTAGHSYACALHPRTLQMLDEVGLARDAIKLGHRIETAAFYESALHRAELKLSLLPVEFPFVLVLQQNILEDLLARKLKERAIDVHWNHQLTDLTMKNGSATATINELAMEGKGYGVPDFEMAVKKLCRPAQISWWARMAKALWSDNGSTLTASGLASRSFLWFMNLKRRQFFRRR